MVRPCIRLLTTLVPALAVLACVEPLEISAIPEDERFSATLSAANEVPPTATTATGTAVFRVVNDTFFMWRVDIAGLDTPTAVHIHPGAAGVNGGVLLSLVGSRRNVAGFTGQFGVGQTKRGTPLSIATISYDSMLVLLRTGNAYVNVHSLRYGGGAIRGQVQPQ